MGETETLVELAKAGDLGKVRAVLEENFLLASQRLPNGETPLMAALYRGHGEVVDALIEAGAEIDVFAAAATGRPEDLRRTLNEATVNAVAYDGWTPLHAATAGRHSDAALLLLERGADASVVDSGGYTPQQIAAQNNLDSVTAAMASRRG